MRYLVLTERDQWSSVTTPGNTGHDGGCQLLLRSDQSCMPCYNVTISPLSSPEHRDASPASSVILMVQAVYAIIRNSNHPKSQKAQRRDPVELGGATAYWKPSEGAQSHRSPSCMGKYHAHQECF